MTPKQAIKLFGSQKELAQVVKRSPSTISGWLKENRIPYPMQIVITYEWAKRK
jgi:hypothetical protein